MNELQIFNNPEFGKIRAAEVNGEPWFVGKDVAQALGYQNPQRAIREHVEDEDKGVTEMVTPGGKQSLPIINESGVYSLIFSSKLPKAKEFKRWVTSEVLPSIHKRGGYMTPEAEKQLTEGLTAMAATVQTLASGFESLSTTVQTMGTAFEALTQRVEAVEQNRNRRTPLQALNDGDNPFGDAPVPMKPSVKKFRKQWMRTASDKLNALSDKCGLPSTTVLHNLYQEMEEEQNVILSEIRLKAIEEHQLDECSVLLAVFYDKPLRGWFEKRVDAYLSTASPTW